MAMPAFGEFEPSRTTRRERQDWSRRVGLVPTKRDDSRVVRIT
jgi:hypothetical protein